jgi:hypothetical protein
MNTVIQSACVPGVNRIPSMPWNVAALRHSLAPRDSVHPTRSQSVRALAGTKNVLSRFLGGPNFIFYSLSRLDLHYVL